MRERDREREEGDILLRTFGYKSMLGVISRGEDYPFNVRSRCKCEIDIFLRSHLPFPSPFLSPLLFPSLPLSLPSSPPPFSLPSYLIHSSNTLMVLSKLLFNKASYEAEGDASRNVKKEKKKKGEGRREKDEGGRKKEEGREGSCFHTICSQMNDDIEVFELSLHSLLIRKVQLFYCLIILREWKSREEEKEGKERS